MIPLRSSERTYTTPTATIILIVANTLVFFYELKLQYMTGYDAGYGTYQLSRLPFERFVAHYAITPDHFRYVTLLTSMFIHGGWLHIIGNMWFLWIFGKGVEDLLGHFQYVAFYLVCGCAGGLVHVAFNPYSPVPTIGASGAIASIMGAYLIKFPRARIVTLVPVFIFLTTFDIPAAFLLIYWFLIQFFSGFGSVGPTNMSSSNVAFLAHVGGFIAGMLLILVVPTRKRYRPWGE
ncbi:MAG: rhomboid family intramembrane serine protease [Bryobacteraceae bacterium]